LEKKKKRAAVRTLKRSLVSKEKRRKDRLRARGKKKERTTLVPLRRGEDSPGLLERKGTGRTGGKESFHLRKRTRTPPAGNQLSCSDKKASLRREHVAEEEKKRRTLGRVLTNHQQAVPQDAEKRKNGCEAGQRKKIGLSRKALQVKKGTRSRRKLVAKG